MQVTLSQDPPPPQLDAPCSSEDPTPLSRAPPSSHSGPLPAIAQTRAFGCESARPGGTLPARARIPTA